MDWLKWLRIYPEQTCRDEIHQQCVKGYREVSKYLDEKQVPLDPAGPKGSTLLKRVVWLFGKLRREEKKTEIVSRQLAACTLAAVGDDPGLKFGDTAWSPAYEDIRNLFKEARGQQEGKNQAYQERNLLVAALSKLFPAYLGRHIGDEDWDDDWRNIVFISLPTGQVSWHIHDSELGLFEHLKGIIGPGWDGHSTEEKYARLCALPTHPANQPTIFDYERKILDLKNQLYAIGQLIGTSNETIGKLINLENETDTDIINIAKAVQGYVAEHEAMRVDRHHQIEMLNQRIERLMESAKELGKFRHILNELAEKGGALVSTGACGALEIASAQACGDSRFQVLDNGSGMGLGFIRRTREWLDRAEKALQEATAAGGLPPALFGDLERARAINGDLVKWWLVTEGLDPGPAPDLSRLSLPELVFATMMIEAENERKKGQDGGRGRSMEVVCDMRLLAAIYTFLHYEPDPFPYKIERPIIRFQDVTLATFRIKNRKEAERETA
jgi:hypothetical protein